MKSIRKPYFDIDVLNAIKNCDKHYEILELSGKEIDDFTEVLNFQLKNAIYNKKNFTLRKKLQK